MRVLHYVDENELSWAEPWFQLLEGLGSEGVENVILCRPGGSLAQRAMERGFEVRTYKPPVAAVPAVCPGLKSVIREVKPDLIHTRLSSAASLGGYWGKRAGVPVLSTVDKFPKVKYYRNSDLLLPCSTAVLNHMAEVGFPSTRMTVVPNAIQADHYVMKSHERESFRREMRVGPDDLVVLGAGRLVDWKGFDDLVESFARIQKTPDSCEKLHLWIAGEGPEGPKLETLAGELGVRERVTFLGFIPDIRKVLWASDIYVHPSWGEEAFGLILLEALASGLPCIATDNGGIPDFVEDGKSGILVPVRNVTRMSEALSRMFEAGTRMSFAGVAAEAASAFDVSKVVSVTLDIYEAFVK